MSGWRLRQKKYINCRNCWKALLSNVCGEACWSTRHRWQKGGGSIPVGGLVKVLAAGGVYLAGDAAGCTHPLSGAGIYAAAASGSWAAEAAGGKGESWYEAYLRSQWQQPFGKSQRFLAKTARAGKPR